MEKLTPNKFGEEKLKSGTSQKTGKPYSFKTIGFVSNEYPDRWYNINYNTTNPLTLGKTYDMDVKSREYNGKTYWDAQLPKSVVAPNAATMYISRNVDAVLAATQIMRTDIADIKSVLGDILGRLSGTQVEPKQPKEDSVEMLKGIEEAFGEPPIESYDEEA